MSALTGPNTKLVQPNGIAFDSSGELYVAVNAYAGGGPDPLAGSSCINVYAAGASGNTAPIRSICGPHTGIVSPAGIAIDASDNLYVANALANNVLTFAPGANGDVSPAAVLSGVDTGLFLPVAVAIDPASKEIFVASFMGSSCGYSGAVTIYRPGASGNAKPIRSLAGSQIAIQDRITQPTAIAFDRNDDVYVTNEGNGAVTEWAPGANAYSTPIAVIYGADTQLDAPEGLALDYSGYIYVSNPGVEHRGILVFAPGSNGDTPPVRIIRGDHTSLGVPMAIALH